MEDAATAEISRSQIWRCGTVESRGRTWSGSWLMLWRSSFRASRRGGARALFEQVALADDFVEFLTLPAYERLLEMS